MPTRTDAMKRRAGGASRSGRTAFVDLTRLMDIVGAFSREKICVVGDMVLDEFVSGEISRVSREAPVLILRHRKTEAYPGGAANAANNIADLGARVIPIGAVGDDEGGRKLLELFKRKGVDVSGIIVTRERPTTTKTRYLAGWSHTTEQQVLRVDREPGATLPERVQQAIERKARAAAASADAVLISDYGMGAASPSLTRKLETKLLTLDSRYRLLEFRDARITAATPNESEVEAEYHTQVGTDLNKLAQLGARAVRDLSAEAVIVTRGKDGLSVFERDTGDAGTASGPQHIPIYGSDTPVDVTGAGDTVIAVFTLALAAGASYFEAAHLANYAGGIVVMKARTATVTRAELETVLAREAAQS
ncbi:MAG TPA: PfkB family carbohydrate kinase [Candidatus Acidoferrales bacterium]|nr:PfkB family carbohydrate kinase [Candidatus Acidoferrales bacterium]